MIPHQTNKKGGERWAEVQVGPPAAENPDGASVAWNLKDNFKEKKSYTKTLPRIPIVLIIGIQAPSNQKAQLILQEEEILFW